MATNVFKRYIFFSILPLLIMPVSEKLMNIGFERKVTFEKYPTAVIDMQNIGRRSLAILEIRPASPESFPDFLKKYKAPRAYVPVIFGEGMNVLYKGPPIPGPLPVLNPLDQDPSLSFQLLFPRIVRREEASNECPYLWMDAARVQCLNEFLEPGSVFRMPVQSKGYSLMDGELWVYALYRNRLLHRIDMKKKKIVESRLPISAIESYLRQQGLLSSKETLCQSVKKSSPKSTRGAQTEKIPKHMADRLNLPSSCIFRATIQNNRLYLIFKKPLVHLTYAWPDLYPISSSAFTRDSLPEWTYNDEEITLEAMEPFKKNRVALWLSFHKGLTYGELKKRNPLSAEIHARSWKQQHSNARLTDDTILLLQSDLLLFILDEKGIRHIYDPYSAFRNESRWKPVGPPFIMDGKVWISVRSAEPDVARRQYKIVQLVPD